MSKHKVLVVDDEPFVLNALKKELGKSYDVNTYLDPEEALDSFKPKEFDVAILDVRMPKMNGVELAEKIRLKDPELPILFFTGYTDPEALSWIHKTKSTYRIPKPWANDLEILVERVIETQRNKNLFNNLIRDTIEILRLGRTISDESVTDIKERMNNLLSFAAVEIYRRRSDGKFMEIENKRCVNGLKENMVETVWVAKEPRILRENGKWTWATKFGDYVVVVYLKELTEETHNYLQLLKEIFALTSEIERKTEEEKKRIYWLFKLNRDSIKSYVSRIFAHQANNYLGAIIGNADYGLMSGSATDTRASLETIINAAQELASTIERYRTCFNETEDKNKKLCDVINSCTDIFVNELRDHGIETTFEIPENTCTVCPPYVWEQIVMNAFLVALDGIKENGKVKFTHRLIEGKDEIRITWEGYRPTFETIDELPEGEETNRFRLYIIGKLAENYGGEYQFKPKPHPELILTFPAHPHNPMENRGMK